MTRRLLTLVFMGGLLVGGLKVAPPARAMPLDQVVAAIQGSGGRYVWAGASLAGADCSGLVSVAQSLATGQPPHRLGDTSTLLAGRWPNAVAGAEPNDRFIIAANGSHMVAQIDGVGIESTTRGQPYRVGSAASSVWDRRYTARYHVDPAVLVAA
jgi:cell wall-associated NlpC family hydrolase